MGINNEIAKLREEVAYITKLIENFKISGKKKNVYYKNLMKGLKWRQKRIIDLKIKRKALVTEIVEELLELA